MLYFLTFTRQIFDECVQMFYPLEVLMSADVCLQSSVHADSGAVLPLAFRPPGTVELRIKKCIRERMNFKKRADALASVLFSSILACISTFGMYVIQEMFDICS